MKNNFHFFSNKEYVTKPEVLEKIGIRGRLAMELSMLDLPIVPGFIIDSEVASKLEDESLTPLLKTYMDKIKSLTGKEYGQQENPMLVKIVLSPNLAIAHYPTLHNYGLVVKTIPGFNAYVGPSFGYHEVQFLVKGALEIEARIAELEKRDKDATLIRSRIKELVVSLDKDQTTDQRRALINKNTEFFPEAFFTDAYLQLEIMLKRISLMLRLDEMDDEDTAILIQPMVYGNYGKDSASGVFYTRNIVTGDGVIQGSFFQETFNEIGAEEKAKDIHLIGPNYLSTLSKLAVTIENHYKEIRAVNFTIENKKLWLINQRNVMTKSTQADIRMILDLRKRKVVDDAFVVNAIKPGQLNQILHPEIDFTTVKKLTKIVGGIAGAPGAAIGRLFFTTETLLDAHKEAQKKDGDTNFILCMPASFAEDVKAIEVAKGVLSSEGGYSAHASVVARQYGKISLVKPSMQFRGKKVVIDGVTLSEGDYVTLHVPYYGEPEIYVGKAGLIEPDPEESGLLEFINICQKFLKKFTVRANADSPREASLALKFGAQGIGLCRTEHMFFDEKRINVFREMILSDSAVDRQRALTKLKAMQKTDFYKLFKIMEGYGVTIRLLDAPLHEFLPHNDDEMGNFMVHLATNVKNRKYTRKEIEERCEALHEFNPMLGHRGCRIAVSFPEIYEMQVEAIFEAVYQLKKEGVKVVPEIMIPIVMNENELRLIIYGKKIEGKAYKGLIDVEREVRKRLGAKKASFKIGTMIELPAAALASGKIARYAEFFSFGTNDLTQTTLGLSRDDFNSFMPDYTLYDLLNGNPFRLLDENVKELIATSVRRGRMTRPDLKKGLCGEQGAIPENVEFCMEVGLDYVSCSTFAIPLALLAVVQNQLKKEAALKTAAKA